MNKQKKITLQLHLPTAIFSLSNWLLDNCFCLNCLFL